MPYLVDTDVLVDVSRNNQAAIAYVERGRTRPTYATRLDRAANPDRPRRLVRSRRVLTSWRRGIQSEPVAQADSLRQIVSRPLRRVSACATGSCSFHIDSECPVKS